MAGPHTIDLRTATGEFKATGGVVYAVILAAGADAATAIFDDNGVNRIKLSAVAESTETVVLPFGVVFSNDITVTLTGTAPQVSCAYV